MGPIRKFCRKSVRHCMIWGFVAMTASLGWAQANAKTSPGETRFKSTCILCHGEDGSGNTTLGKQLQAPDLRSAAVQKLSDSELLHIISNGKGNMPAFQNQFSEKEIQELVAHIRELGKAKK